MANKYSQIPIGSVFVANGGNYRKLDDFFYMDLSTGFESTWNPIFDDTIVPSPNEVTPPSTNSNTADKFIVDSQTRVVKPNPNYQSHQLCIAERVFAEMWGTAEYDCGPEEYDYMARVSVPAFGAMKELGRVVGLNGSDITTFPAIVEYLTAAYEKHHTSPYIIVDNGDVEVESPVVPTPKKTTKKKKLVAKKTPEKKVPAKKTAKKKAKKQ